jgi:hypothetical protein
MQCGEKRPLQPGRRYNGARWLRFSPAFFVQKGNDWALVPNYILATPPSICCGYGVSDEQALKARWRAREIKKTKIKKADGRTRSSGKVSSFSFGFAGP